MSPGQFEFLGVRTPACVFGGHSSTPAREGHWIFLTPTRKFSHFTEGKPRPLRLSNQLGLLELAMCHPGLPLGCVLCVLLLKALLANGNS